MFNRLYTANEAIAILEEEGHFDRADVFIGPPSDGEGTEEDSGDEEGGSIDNLSGRQLRAQASVTLLEHGVRRPLQDENDSDTAEELFTPIGKGDAKRKRKATALSTLRDGRKET